MSGLAPRGGPTPSPLVHIDILSVPTTGSIWVRFLGGLRQLGTHFKRPQSLVCWGRKDCPPRVHELPYRSKWYAPGQYYVVDRKVWRMCVIEVTEGLEQLLRDHQLRGEVWCLYREVRDGEQYKNILGTFEERLADHQVSPVFDVDPIIKRVFKVTELPSSRIGNLMPPRPVAEDEIAPPPSRLLQELEAETGKFSSDELLKRQKVVEEGRKRMRLAPKRTTSTTSTSSTTSTTSANGQANGQANGHQGGH